MYYPIQLDKIRNFRYGMRAIDMLEKKLKKPIAKIEMDEMSMSEMATFIWAGLAHEDKNLTPEKIMDLIDEYSDVTTIFEAAGAAMEVAFRSGKSQEATMPDVESQKNS